MLVSVFYCNGYLWCVLCSGDQTTVIITSVVILIQVGLEKVKSFICGRDCLRKDRELPTAVAGYSKYC